MDLLRDVIVGGAGLFGIGFLVLIVLALFRKGPFARIATHAVDGHRQSAMGLARERGWWVGEGEAVADREPDPALAAERVHPVRCELVIDGGAEQFVAESWSVGVRNLGSFVRIPAYQHVIRLPSPSRQRFLVKSVPTKHELRHFPVSFKADAGFAGFHTSVLIGGDFLEVQDRLAPLVYAMTQSRLWVIGVPGTLYLVSPKDPDRVELEQRLFLGRAIVEALS